MHVFYLCHTSVLPVQVLKVRKEYEKLHKQHQRYKKDLMRKKDQVMDEKKESDEEIRRLREKLEVRKTQWMMGRKRVTKKSAGWK